MANSRAQSGKIIPAWTRWIHIAWLLLIPFSGNAATPMVSLGQEHALALRSDGTVVSWGSDRFGKLGTGRSIYATTPAMVPGFTGVRAIGSGRYHSLAIRQDGTVWTWGSNSRGQLGDGTSTDRTSPVQVPGIGNAVMACGGAHYSVVLKQDGILWSWGDNFFGNLGNGTQNNSLVPVQVVGLSSVVSVACGSEHVIALRQDGTVWTWGNNNQGRLGDGTTTDRWQPVPVPGLGNAVAVAAGGGISAALKPDGTVWEWGPVVSTGASRLSPVQSVGITGAVKIRAGEYHYIAAIKADGTTWWFWASGTTPAIQNPVGSLESVAAGANTLLLKSDRTVMAFGVNNSGEVGDGTTTYRPTPVPVVGISNIVAVAEGASHSLALDANGNVWAWGADSAGQLGRGGTFNSSIPLEISGLSNIVQVSAGADHSLAVDQNGNIWSWGDNVGDGTATPRSAPVRLTSITNVQAVAAGGLHSLALKRDGTVWAWGANYIGQLGNGTYGGTNAPAQVPGLTNVVAIAAGNGHSLAVKQDGTVWAWGRNDYGQLGFGTVTPFIIFLGSVPLNGLPAQIPGLSGVRSVVAGYFWNSYALKADGTVMAWGRNEYGALGDGSTTERHTPVSVTGLTGVVEIAAGVSHALARRADGSVWGWGADSSGELGLDPNTYRAIAAAIANVNSIQQISAGDSISGLVRQDGLVQMGGSNRTGQLGDGTFAERQSFVLVVNETVNGFLDLIPEVPNTIPPDKIPPFFVATYKSGNLSATSLAVDVRGITPIGSFAAATGVGPLVDGGYNVYVAAAVPYDNTLYYFQLDSGNVWSVLTWPMADFVRGVDLGSQDALVRVTILQNADLSALIGTIFAVGYGTSPDEMVANARYRVIYTVTQQ